jgi:hypothetical protein
VAYEFGVFVCILVIVVVSAAFFGVITEFRGDNNRKTRSKAKEFYAEDNDNGGAYNYLASDEAEEDFFFDAYWGDEDEELLW